MEKTLAPCPVNLTQALVRCPSVTPEEGGALSLLEGLLKDAGFETHRVVFDGDGSYPVDNLYARYGTGAPHFCYGGHTDVVPVGDRDAWSHDPFCGDIIDGNVYGRGAEDMKGSVAAFASAAIQYIRENPDFGGSISLLITGDEEADSINGTVKLIEWADKRGEAIDAAIVGEPTNQGYLGNAIKNGRRGSFSARLTVEGVQGHVAYPEAAQNPITAALPLLSALTDTPLDEGTKYFPPSNLEITTVDVGNETSNVVPARLTARFNVRFNDLWTGETLAAELSRRLANAAPEGITYHFAPIKPISESFVTEAPALLAPLQAAIEDVTGHTPGLSTSGGTSDARFIKDYCPVVEFGLVFKTLHKVNECTPVDDIKSLSGIFHRFLERYFTQV